MVGYIQYRVVVVARVRVYSTGLYAKDAAFSRDDGLTLRISFIRYDCVGFDQRDGTRQRGCTHGVHVRVEPLGGCLPGARW